MDLTLSLTKILKSILGDNFKPRDDEFISPHVTIWYLKRTTPANQSANPPFEIRKTSTPAVAWYRELYKAVGGPWLWWERIAMKDETFYALFAKNDRVIVTPIIDGVEAGFSEVLYASEKMSEIVYFGLKPEFVGKGIASSFMEEVVAIARKEGVEEIRLNTCSLDHPRARGFYKSRGYEEYHEVQGPVHIPKGLLDENLLDARVTWIF